MVHQIRQRMEELGVNERPRSPLGTLGWGFAMEMASESQHILDWFHIGDLPHSSRVNVVVGPAAGVPAQPKEKPLCPFAHSHVAPGKRADSDFLTGWGCLWSEAQGWKSWMPTF